jgi:hypothetical protein
MHVVAPPVPSPVLRSQIASASSLPGRDLSVCVAAAN